MNTMLDQGYHGVLFYADESTLCDRVFRFINAGVEEGDGILVYATRAHHDTFARHAPLPSSVQLLDADETLATFMVGDMPHAPKFRAAMSEGIERARGRSKSGGVRVYGELVDVLWQRGQADAAIRLEELWNELAESQPLSILCGYSHVEFDETQLQQNKRIMVVDDNADAADLLCRLLTTRGHAALACYDGASALACASDFQPQLAVLDIQLPAMDGHALAKRLRLLPGLDGLKLIALTSLGTDADRDRGQESGFDMYCVKPFDPTILNVEISRLIS